MELQVKAVTFQWMLDVGILKIQKLYESIVIIKWPDQYVFNTSAMGVKFTRDHEMYLRPYTETDTYDLLMNSCVNIVTVNLTDDIEVFAQSALTGLHSGPKTEELEQSLLNIFTDYAYLKKTQYVILGEILEREKAISGQRGRVLLKIKEVYKTNLFPQPVNRGDNLALEAIVHTSKIPAVKNQRQIQELIEKVKGLLVDIRRFSASKRALAVCDYIDAFLER